MLQNVMNEFLILALLVAGAIILWLWSRTSSLTGEVTNRAAFAEASLAFAVMTAGGPLSVAAGDQVRRGATAVISYITLAPGTPVPSTRVTRHGRQSPSFSRM
jgi:hypothetical protein